MNKNMKNYSKKNNSKKNIVASILLVVLALAMIVGAVALSATRVEAKTNRAGAYTLYGTYNIGDGNVSGYMERFSIQISTQYFTDDSGTNGTTKYNNATYDWTYFSFYIHADDIKEHQSFKLTRNGSYHTNKTLSGDAAGYLYQGSLSDGDYVLTYVGTYKESLFTTKTYTFTYKFTVDTIAPSVSLKAGGTTISSGSYTNKAITFTASDSYSTNRVYYKSPSSSSYTYTTGSKSVSATSSNNGWWYFYGSDTYQSSGTYSVYLDTVAPVGKITNSSGTTLSSGSYTNKPVKYTATDTGGISYLQVQTPGASSWSNYSSGTALSSSQGWYYFRAVDKAGNISSTSSVYYDSGVPTGTLYGGTTSKSSGSYTNASYIKYAASDSASGIKNVYVLKPGASSYTTYTSGTQLTAEGTYYFYCVDYCGNQSSIVSITLDKTAPIAQLYVDGKAVSNGTYTNGGDISFQCGEKSYVKMPGATSFVDYVSGTEFNKPGKYVFYGKDTAGNSTGEYTIIIDRTIKQASISNMTNGTTNGDVVITWTNGDANSFAPIRTVTVNGKRVSSGTAVHTIDTGSYIVKVVDAAGNEWQTEFKSTKKNVLTDTLVKEFFEVPDINGDIFAFASYEKALEFATARENSKVKTGEWNNSTWDTGIPMDTVDAANAKNGTYYIYYKSGNAEELVAYFTIERLNEVINEYAKADIKDYFFWEKAPATAGPGENLYSYSAGKTILANAVNLGENIGVTIDGEAFVGTVVETEGKHLMVISDSYGNTCEYNLVIIRTLPDIFYAIGEGSAQKADLERTYYFKDGITITITDALDEMAMFNLFDKDGNLIKSYSLGESCILTESGVYTVQSVNHAGESEEFKIVISRSAPEVSLKANEEDKQLVITVTGSADEESHLQTFEVYKSTDDGNTWTLLETDDYGTAVELGTLVYKFRTSGMYKIVITDEFRTGIDAISGQITYTQPAPTGDLAGVENGGHTNKEVTFTWDDEAKVTVTKDGSEIEYNSGDKLTADGKYTIVFENFDGSKSTYEFIIDTVIPEVAVEGHKADLPVNTPVTVNIIDEEATAVLIKDGVEVGEYVSGTAVTDEGEYIVRVTDKAQNVTEVAFEIDKSVAFDINVNDGGLANSVTVTAGEDVEIIITKDGTVIEYEEGTAITVPGKYTVKVVDELDNESNMAFTIVNPVVKSFSHSFDDTEGFEKVLINGTETRLNYGALELTAAGTYEVGVVVDGKTYNFTVKLDNAVDFDINVHNQGFANSVKLTANENVTLTMTKNGEAFAYEMGTELTEAAAYTVKMVDALGNTAEMSFTIIPGMLAKFEAEIDEMPGFEKVLVNGEEVTLEKGTLLLNQTGAFEVSIIANGAEQKFTVNVDATAPTLTITGVENGGITKDAVILSDASEEATVKVMKGEDEIEYTLGDEIKESGVYKVTVTDAMGNATEYNFEIEKGVNGGLIALFVILGLGLIGAVVFVVLKKKKVF